MSLVGYDSSGSDADADAERVDAGDATVSTGLLEAARVPPIADQESAASTAGSTTTCPPDDLPGEWTECVDAGSGEAYYWNKLTGDTTWERARCFEQIAPSNKRQRTGESMDRIARTEDGAARTGGLGNSFFSELVRRGSVATSAPPVPGKAGHAAPLLNGWREALDAQGSVYYYHVASGKTAWERPVASSVVSSEHAPQSKPAKQAKANEKKYNPMSAIWQKSQFGKPPSQR
jgi:hypothetical protein